MHLYLFGVITLYMGTGNERLGLSVRYSVSDAKGRTSITEVLPFFVASGGAGNGRNMAAGR